MSSKRASYKLPRDLLIEVDSREQKPLIFPSTLTCKVDTGKSRTFRIHTTTATLDAADYRLSSHPLAGGVERKSGLNELSQNLLTKDRTRFTNAFQRLLDQYQSPLLLVEGQPKDILGVSKHHKFAKPGEVADYVSALSIRTRVPIMWMPAHTMTGKRNAGELVARWLVQSALIFAESMGGLDVSR
jgi:ERCC4-type nuclease